MNENFLQENPFQIFDDFVQIPDPAFEHSEDSAEISALMDTILENDDFARVIGHIYYSTPQVIFDTERTLKGYLKQAKNGEYGNGKKKEYVEFFVGKVLQDIKEIVAYGGVFPQVKIRITKTDPNAILPKYQDDGDAGADIYCLEHTVIQPHSTTLVRTGIRVMVPGGYEIQLRPRSGLSAKTGLRLPNSPATIDSGFRGEVKVIVENTSDEPITLTEHSRIAQMVLKRQPKIIWDEVTEDVFNTFDTNRGEGFGSSGI